MNIVKLDINDLVSTSEVQTAVAAIGFDEYERRFNAIFNDDALVGDFRNLISEQMKDAMEGWDIVVINGELGRKWLQGMALSEFPTQPVFTISIGDTPYIYVDMTVLPTFPEDIRDVSIDYMLVKEGVHREQVIRGDLVLFNDTLTWQGVSYTTQQIHAMSHEKTMELLDSDATDNQLDEKDLVLLVDCQHEWEREAQVRTLAGLSHVYEMELTDVQRKLVDDWVKEMWDTVIANADDENVELTSPVLNFEVGTKVGDIKEWFNALFMCNVDEM